MADHNLPGTSSGNIYAYDVWETKYPYINLKESGLNNALGSMRRGLAGVNPFANPQIPSQQRMALGPRWGNGWFTPDPFPNGVHFERIYPTHYNPTKDETYQPPNVLVDTRAPGVYNDYVLTADKLPKGCVRSIQSYRRCAMVNGEEKCREEGHDIGRICPSWALDSMREKNKFLMKVRAIQNHQLRSGLEVSSYNKGRSITDVADKTWIDGTRENLRPDTMWPDQRYAKITQQEVNEAKKRVAERGDRRRKQEELDHHNGPVKAHAADAHDIHVADHEQGHHAYAPHIDVDIQKPKRLYP